MMKHFFSMGMLGLFLMTVGCVACSKDDDVTSSETINPGNDPNFTIVANTDGVLKSFNRKVKVFGIDIYAVAGVTDAKLLHAANVMAQYLDNDEDGTVDNQLVVDKMVENKASLVMWKKESDLNINPPSDREIQDLGNDETIPAFVANGKTGQFDAALEEVWHIITHAGYAAAYPAIFGEEAGTVLSDAMDVARGGSFSSIPNPYPSTAWYTYDDATCTYDCQSTEYFYWAMTSILGAQANRSGEINQEWKLHTKALVMEKDNAIYTLLTDAKYKLPTKLPDGSYTINFLTK